MLIDAIRLFLPSTTLVSLVAIATGCATTSPAPFRTSEPFRMSAADDLAGTYHAASSGGSEQVGMLYSLQDPPPPSMAPAGWLRGEPVYQGFFGAAFLNEATVDQSGSPPYEVDDEDLDNYPVIGGGAQLKLGGEHVDIGLELMFLVTWRSDVAAFSTGGGGTVVALDVDLFVIELFGGPFVSAFLGEDVRVYAGAGPLMQFIEYSQLDDADDRADGSGFGVGGYARAGIEYRIFPDTLLGVGARWFDSKVDLSDNLGDLDLRGTQALITVTTGI